ncbi:MAG: cytochrome [Mucilaginibacter sp.]|nr:cytochrome [Mucilaginibacter sp.]
MKIRKSFLIVITGGLVIFIGLQFIRPEITHPPVTGDLQAPPDVKAIFERACYDCHSNETNLRWYDRVAPICWRVAAHVNSGRAGLNFSEWNKLAPADQEGKLWESVNQAIAKAMPLKDYEMLHTEAKLSATDVAILKRYLLSMVHDRPADTAKLNAASKQYNYWKKSNVALQLLPKAANGITYIPDYKNWQAISTTERLDNGTMRVIFGNDIAVRAAHSGRVNPWPNGTTFAKVAWDQLADKEGNVTTGAFKQIEYMIKDDRKYAATHGWGFARFKTLKMVPYGKTAMFATECINCHQPVANRDFVFTSPLKN